jgi:hypothetical protein
VPPARNPDRDENPCAVLSVCREGASMPGPEADASASFPADKPAVTPNGSITQRSCQVPRISRSACGRSDKTILLRGFSGCGSTGPPTKCDVIHRGRQRLNSS